MLHQKQRARTAKARGCEAVFPKIGLPVAELMMMLFYDGCCAIVLIVLQPLSVEYFMSLSGSCLLDIVTDSLLVRLLKKHRQSSAVFNFMQWMLGFCTRTTCGFLFKKKNFN